MLTKPESSAPAAEQANNAEESEPFELADGNTYVEHGMAVEADRIRSSVRVLSETLSSHQIIQIAHANSLSTHRHFPASPEELERDTLDEAHSELRYHEA